MRDYGLIGRGMTNDIFRDRWKQRERDRERETEREREREKEEHQLTNSDINGQKDIEGGIAVDKVRDRWKEGGIAFDKFRDEWKEGCRRMNSS